MPFNLVQLAADTAGNAETLSSGQSLIWILLFPLIGMLIWGILGKRLRREMVGTLASVAIGLSFCFSLYYFFSLIRSGEPFKYEYYKWIISGEYFSIPFGLRFDHLSAVMALVVTGVSCVIHIYSIGYMRHDHAYWRFFCYLNLFVFFMLVLVLGDNLLMMFVGWEGVGLCSYLLIGFWYDDRNHPSETNAQGTGNSIAGKKAFITNRIGDFGFVLGIFFIFITFSLMNNLGSPELKTAYQGAVETLKDVETQKQVVPLKFEHLKALIENYPDGALPVAMLTLIGILLFVGATGKSAQIPLYVWLPDAMAGPTPVSALIHAATMVTAGVYMVARMSFLYVNAPTAMMVVAGIGALTAFFAATIGLAQNDIKKVLAYSTVSQLGYMFIAVGVGAYAFGIFHLMTHAFFKACLFLGSGVVIDFMHHKQDIRGYGGLRKYLPITHITWVISAYAIAGLPFLSGFYSKDAILEKAIEFAPHDMHWFGYLVFALGLGGAIMTAFYMTRVTAVTFWGTPRVPEEKIKTFEKPPGTMKAALVILAFLAIIGGYINVPSWWTGGKAQYFVSWVTNWTDDKDAAKHMHVFGSESHSDKQNLGGSEPGKKAELETATQSEAGGHGEHHMPWKLALLLTLISVGVAFAGVIAGIMKYGIKESKAVPPAEGEKLNPLHLMFKNKYWVDEAYEASLINPIHMMSKYFFWKFFDVMIVDGIVNGLAWLTLRVGSWVRRFQTGLIPIYALAIVLGLVGMLVYFFASGVLVIEF
ncbi:MAG: NADH-quinone oxidoreductase subunit L [Planctomycetota bacterium]|jgi:NADH-quinone oxidoreductase subunit L